MPLSRLVAPLAAALLFGAPQFATAATLSVDIPGCSQVSLSGQGSSYTISCTQAAMTCVAQSNSNTPTGGSAAMLSVACSPAATAVTWSASRDCTTPTGGAVGQASVTEVVGGRSCVYTADASAPNFTGSASVAVVWQGSSTQPPANAPSGCAVTRNPTSGSVATTGGSISMSASCSGGGAVTSWSWRKNATTGWSVAKGPTDTLPANTGSAAVTYTYGVTACSNGACASEVQTTFTVAGSAPVGFCGQLGDVEFVDLNWGNTPTDVTIPPGRTIVGRLAVPANASSPLNQAGLVTVAEYVGSQADRVMTISSAPCDFRGWTAGQNFPAQDPTGANGPMAWVTGINPSRQFLLAGDPPGNSPPKPLLNPGQTYYVNLQTIWYTTGQNSCPTTNCGVRFTVNTPR